MGCGCYKVEIAFFSFSDMNAGSTLKIVGVNLLGLKLDFLNLLLSSLSVINSY